MNQRDTIAAISTPPGIGGIAVVRLSGPDALEVALRHLSTPTLDPRHATYCRFDEIDDIVATYFPAGYTGEPTVEFSCHGSLYVQQALLQALLDDGARLAEAGEFTLRAFLHRRLNLSQAEAVADLIAAATPAQHRLAVSQLRGSYAQKLKDLRQQLVDLTALLELELDFSQENVEFADRTRLQQLLSTLHSELAALLDSFATGNALKQGIPIAIVGRPNVGKSSLLNALLGDDRAIVSSIPGTTRDTVEETLTLQGITFRLIDTAGLRHTDDTIEAQGVDRSRKAIQQATIVIHLLDATEPAPQSDIDLSGKTVLTVFNKCDLLGDKCADMDSSLTISAKTGLGLDALKQALVDAVGSQAAADTLLSNPRHRDALQRVQAALGAASQALDNGLPADLLAVDLRDALYHLGTVTGEVTNNELLSSIFSRFCIGK